MIGPTSSWFKIMELPLVKRLWTYNINGKELIKAEDIFDKSSDRISKLVNKTWLCRYPRCQTLVYDNRSEFKLCESYGIKHKLTMIKNPQANAVLEHVHQVLGQMLCTAEIDMANSVTPDDVNVLLDNAAWALCSTYHTVLTASPGMAIFGQDMLFNIHSSPTGTKLEITGNP